MRVLIVWEDAGDRIRMYEELVTSDEFKAMSAAHGHLTGYCNTPVEDAALDFLNRWLEGRRPFYDSENKDKPIREIAACSVIHAGWCP